MSIFGVFEKKDTKVNLDTESLVKKVNQSKDEVHKICLTKKPLNGLKARVGIVIDRSGSMGSMYSSGMVQRVVEKIVPLAMEFDDNGSMECWLFNDGFKRLKDVTLNNLYDFIKREAKGLGLGGTNYAPVMKSVYEEYKRSKVPCYVVFITDGDNWDKEEAEERIKEYAKYPIFWQFVGIGKDSFSFLESLDDMEGRYVDNADFFSVENPDNITYKQLLDEFPTWLENGKVKGMIGG